MSHEQAQQEDNEPCRNLWAAVLTRAIRDMSDTTKDAAIIKSRAKKWLQSSKDGMGSFKWICGLLKMDVEQTRQFAFTPGNKELLSDDE